MTWAGFAQMLLTLFAGAWLHSSGVRHVSPIAGAETAKRLFDLVSGRNGRKDEKDKPTLPRVGV